MTSPETEVAQDGDDDEGTPPCILCFNAGDPSGAGGLSGDVTAIASVGGHALPVTCGAYARDSAEIVDHFPLDEEAVAEQARVILEDVGVHAIKAGFVGSPEALSVVAAVASDYADLPLVAYMPNLSWWDDDEIDSYLDAYKELLLPQASVLVGNHNTLWRWLLPDWSSDRSPSARDIARAAAQYGVPCVLVTGIALPDQFLDNVLATPQTVLGSAKFERFDASFTGAGDTLTAALAAMLATGADMPSAVGEALTYLDRSLSAGFRPGMGHVLPDRLFWAQGDDDDDEGGEDEQAASAGNGRRTGPGEGPDGLTDAEREAMRSHGKH